MRDFLCKVYNKLYGFLDYADMRLICDYQSWLSKVEKHFLNI